MTWLEFKTAVEAAGVKDETEIDYIDMRGSEDSEQLSVRIHPDWGVIVH